MKVRVAVVVPLKLHTLTEASVSLPRFIDNNFAIATDNTMSIRSPEKLTMNLKGVRSGVSATGEKVLTGVIKEEDLSGSGLSIRVARNATLGPNVIKDPFVHASSYIIQTIKKVEAPAPSHLVLVVDGSQSVKDHLKEIKSALTKLPASIAKSVIIAYDQNGAAPEILKFDEGMKQLDKVALTGGQDNLQAVVKAAEAAGEAKGGTVLWIHGPQPSFNEEIYIMAPYIATPKFYELALDNGVMDAHEFFKNHREIGPFSAIARSATAGDDLERFIAKWQPGGTDFAVTYTALDKADTSKNTTAAQASEIACLASSQKVEEMLHKGKIGFAAVVACAHNIVTPVSLAAVLPHHNRSSYPISTANNAQVTSGGDADSQTSSHEIATNNSSSSSRSSSYSQAKYDSFSEYSPTLQGATNGTIGPQGADATYITGINTAGTVRVNNMANLEAMLSIFANGFEILGVLYGGALAVKAIFALAQGSPQERDGYTHPQRLAFGALCIIGGLAVPGLVNWFVASARDANLFS